MTGPLNGGAPAAVLCRAAGCTRLLSRTIQTHSGDRPQTYCEISGRIPGNMSECPLDVPEEELKVLSVRQPWASLVAMGIKILDIRSRDCHYRGPVAIYATRGHVRRKDRKYFEEVLGREISSLPHGKIIAMVDITGSIRFDNPEKFAIYSECHYLSPFYFEEGMTVYGWILENVRPLTAEIGFKMPKGCVNWSKIRSSVIEAYLPGSAEVMA